MPEHVYSKNFYIVSNYKNPKVVCNSYDNINNTVGRTKTKTKIKSFRNIVRERRPTQVNF